jgi:hypothetical protein
MTDEKSRRPSHHAQWAAQFAVASELCRRRYQVALTMGNHPTVDMMVMSPSGKQFKIDVKGLYRPNYWIIRRRHQIDPDLYYVLAFVPEPPALCEFFVLSHEEVVTSQHEEIEEWRLRRPEIGHDYPVQGIKWKKSKQFKDCWETLPA